MLLHAGRFISDLNDNDNDNVNGNENGNENEKRPTSGGRRAFWKSEVGVFGLGIEAGTVLTDTRKIAMTEDGGIGVVFLQTAE